MEDANIVLDYGWAATDLESQLRAQGFSIADDSWGPGTFAAIKECYLQGMITKGELGRIAKRFNTAVLRKSKVQRRLNHV